MRNKKADMSSLGVLLVIIFILALTSLIVVRIVPEIMDNLADGLSNTPNVPQSQLNRSTQTLEQAGDNAPIFLDFMVLGVFIAFLLGLVISSYFIEGTPVTIILAIIFFTILVFISALFVSVFDDIKSTSAFASTIASMPYTNFLIGIQLPIIIAVIGFIVVSILIGKSRSTPTL